MRVLHVVPTFYPAVAYGGPIYSLLHLCLNLRECGCEVKVLTTDAHRDLRLTAAQQADPMLSSLNIRFCPRVGRGMCAPRLLHRLVEDVRWAHVIHLTAVYNFPTLPTLLLARVHDKPLVWSPRGTLQRWAGSRRVFAKASWERVCRRILPQRTALHVTSEQEASRSAARVADLPAWVIPNGVEIPSRPAPPLNDGVLKLLFIGRLDPIKGVENLIESVAMLKPTNWTLKIAGQGEPAYVAKLRRFVSSVGLSNSVEFCGHLEGQDKYHAFADSDIVVVPSYSENFGLVIAEALAHARPVIASRATPWQEIEERGCGLWVENNPASLATAIQQLAERDRVAMGQRGREWMQESFSWQERARSMMSLYESLLAA